MLFYPVVIIRMITDTDIRLHVFFLHCSDAPDDIFYRKYILFARRADIQRFRDLIARAYDKFRAFHFRHIVQFANRRYVGIFPRARGQIDRLAKRLQALDRCRRAPVAFGRYFRIFPDRFTARPFAFRILEAHFPIDRSIARRVGLDRRRYGDTRVCRFALRRGDGKNHVCGHFKQPVARQFVPCSVIYARDPAEFLCFVRRENHRRRRRRQRKQSRKRKRYDLGGGAPAAPVLSFHVALLLKFQRTIAQRHRID